MSSQSYASGRTRLLALPARATRLLGRGQEMASLVALLRQPDVRLVTLTGPGGVGKTRLGLAVAAQVSAAYRDGVCFVDLSSTIDPGLVAPTIARCLGLKETGRARLLDRLLTCLRDCQTLLVLDNFEQVLPAATLLAWLLESCPRLTVLATSRTVLRLGAEHEFPVPPLSVPDLDRLPDIETLSRYDAVALFVQRARQACPEFALTPANAQAVAEVCVSLDGLPLAVELAAARAGLLSPPALLGQLGRRLAVLTVGSRDAPARHQTLRKTMDWSYELLGPAEQRLFSRLAVFQGGGSLEAIAAVCDADGAFGQDFLDGIGALVDHSLLHRWEHIPGEPRFGMLETIREYALEHLKRRGEAELVRRWHAEHYLAVAEQAEPELTGSRQAAWFARLESEHDNLRAALQWSIDSGKSELALGLGASLHWFWLVRGHLSEGRRWLRAALANPHPGSIGTRARALHAAGVLAWNQGDLDVSRQLLEEALALRHQAGDRRSVARTLVNLAVVTFLQGGAEPAAPLYEESMAIFRELSDWDGVADTLTNLGLVGREAGDYPSAQLYLEESLALRRDLGDQQGAARALAELGIVARKRGQDEAARARFEESLRLVRSVGVTDVAAQCLEGLAELARTDHLLRKTAQLLAAAETLRQRTGRPLQGASDRADYARTLSATRLALGTAEFDAAWSSGRTLTVDEAMNLALSTEVVEGSVATHGGTAVKVLTRREREVAKLVARGLTNRQIAEALVITEGTAEVHVANIKSKLSFHSRAQLATWATQQGLLTQTPA